MELIKIKSFLKLLLDSVILSIFNASKLFQQKI